MNPPPHPTAPPRDATTDDSRATVVTAEIVRVGAQPTDELVRALSRNGDPVGTRRANTGQHPKLTAVFRLNARLALRWWITTAGAPSSARSFEHTTNAPDHHPPARQEATRGVRIEATVAATGDNGRWRQGRWRYPKNPTMPRTDPTTATGTTPPWSGRGIAGRALIVTGRPGVQRYRCHRYPRPAVTATRCEPPKHRASLVDG